MCLAIPAKIISIQDNSMAMAVAEVGGIRKDVCLMLVDDVQVGDYVIVHTGFALSRLDQEEAEKTLELFAEMVELAGNAGPP